MLRAALSRVPMQATRSVDLYGGIGGFRLAALGALRARHGPMPPPPPPHAPLPKASHHTIVARARAVLTSSVHPPHKAARSSVREEKPLGAFFSSPHLHLGAAQSPSTPRAAGCCSLESVHASRPRSSARSRTRRAHARRTALPCSLRAPLPSARVLMGRWLPQAAAAARALRRF